MKRWYAVVFLGACCVLALTERIVHSESKSTPSGAQVHLVITDQTFDDNNEVPVLTPQKLQVKVGKDAAKIEQLIPAQGDNAESAASTCWAIWAAVEPDAGTPELAMRWSRMANTGSPPWAAYVRWEACVEAVCIR